MALDDDPRRKLPASLVQEEGEEGAEKAIMSVAGTGAGVGGDTAVPVPVVAACYFCGGAPAVVHCRADSAGLCLPCDRHVHGANTVSSRHARAPLCAACRAAPASCRRRGRFLCSDCDFEDHHRGVELELELELEPPPPLHDRATVEGYTGCPTVGELAAILGVHHGCVEKPATADGGRDDDGWWSVREEPQVLSLDDVIVATTSCHGLQPLLNLNSSSPKNRSSPCGELEGEVLRQLRELSKSEAAYAEAEPAGDQLPPWASSEFGIGHGDFGASGTEASYAVPSCEREAWIATDCTDPPDARYAEAEAARQEVPASSSAAEPSLTSFVEISDVCPGMSRSGTDVNGGSHGHPPPVAVQLAQAQPKNGGYDIAYPDRGTVISRYKEKRKNRRFGKRIRYESRKARADGRLRINGRFAKSN